jgi:hypothetical protein
MSPELPSSESPGSEVIVSKASDSTTAEPLPAEQVFFSDATLPSLPLPGPPGPGFLESIAWLVGFYAVQFAAAGVALIGIGILYATTHPLVSPAAPRGAPFDANWLMRNFGAYIEQHLPAVLGFSGLATVLYGAVAVSWRLRRQQGLRGLGLRLPSAGHMALVALAMIPLSLLCSELQKLMFAIFPRAESELEQLFEQLAAAPLLPVVWALAAAPALGEELIFRGLIGRGLIARSGVVRGVFYTSLLFGVMHLNPAQAMGVIPLGIAMHFVYLTTRSFWAPVMLHLLNNGFAVMMLKYSDWFPPSKFLDSEQSTPLHLLTVSAAMVTAIGLLLWQTRVQFVRQDGTLLTPACPAGELPHPDLKVVPISQTPQLLLLACGAFNSMGFLVVLWRLVVAA